MRGRRRCRPYASSRCLGPADASVRSCAPGNRRRADRRGRRASPAVRSLDHRPGTESAQTRHGFTDSVTPGGLAPPWGGADLGGADLGGADLGSADPGGVEARAADHGPADASPRTSETADADGGGSGHADGGGSETADADVAGHAAPDAAELGTIGRHPTRVPTPEPPA